MKRLSLSGNKAKLPQVTSQFTPKDIAITRGLSDSFALRHLQSLGPDSQQVPARGKERPRRV